MSYDDRERSTHGGAPVELYEFARGTLVERFTSAASEIVLGPDTYAAATLRRSSLAASTEQARNAVKVTCPRDFPIAELFRVTPPTEVIALTIKRFHRGDAEVAVIWMGRVLNCEWQGASAVLNCEPVSSSLKRTGLRRLYQRQCPRVLYQCGVVRSTVSIDTTVTSVVGSVLGVAALDAMPYPGGFVEWDRGAEGIERRFISGVSGLNLTLDRPFQGIPIGQAVTVSPGCDHTMAMCDTVYDNLPNYGGFPFIPIKNPFDGTPVY
ncbi:phage BR0599 family protein [Caldimonas sp. KR1-144]|uniref:phage BR0599 family protein n=1 Tax=Caldimonas sp. KR1-144 TaxID=3400911 RepID=UPI003C0523C2